MEFQHDKSWSALTEILNLKTTAKEAWLKFIEFHEEIVPKTYWSQLKIIDIESEQTNIVNWITTIMAKQPIPKKIVAIWIGLLKLAGENQSEIPTIYFGGSDHYSIGDNQWANDLKYLPANRYAQPSLLNEIDILAKTDEENYEFLDWIFPLAYCAFTFDEIIRTKLNKKILLKHKDRMIISIGYDNGDYIDLTQVQN